MHKGKQHGFDKIYVYATEDDGKSNYYGSLTQNWRRWDYSLNMACGKDHWVIIESLPNDFMDNPAKYLPQHRSRQVIQAWAQSSEGCHERHCPAIRVHQIEAIVVLSVLALFLAIVLPAVQHARDARREACTNNLKQIGSAIHNFGQAMKVFPAGTVCTSTRSDPPISTMSGPRRAKRRRESGTGFLLRILPFMEGNTLAKNWQRSEGISSTMRWALTATTCSQTRMSTASIVPTRRAGLRRGFDEAMMLSPAWTGGGTHYAGCAGRHVASPSRPVTICATSMHYQPHFCPIYDGKKVEDAEKKRWGIFGRVYENVLVYYPGTWANEITDGPSNTIMTRELQRITGLQPTSKDGWVIGGPATLFTTGAMFRRSGNTVVPVASGGLLINNGFFGSPAATTRVGPTRHGRWLRSVPQRFDGPQRLRPAGELPMGRPWPRTANRCGLAWRQPHPGFDFRNRVLPTRRNNPTRSK